MQNNHKLNEMQPEDAPFELIAQIDDDLADESALYPLRLKRGLMKSKYPVLLASSKHSSKLNFVLKVFPKKDKNPNSHYVRESRFMKLKKHKHIITPIKKLKLGKLKLTPTSEPVEASGLLMPYAEKGDFFSMIIQRTRPFSEMLARTYFVQILQGISHLHDNGIAHCDLKLENLVLDADYLIKIIDFDTAKMKEDKQYRPQGTPSYRAPEILVKKHVSDYTKCDVYSIGIILFIMVCRSLPWKENDPQGEKLRTLFIEDKEAFWKKHADIQGRDANNLWSPHFQNLFEGMCAQDPADRVTLKQAKFHKWTMGKIYEDDEVADALLNGNYFEKTA